MKHPLIFLAVIIVVTILLNGCGEGQRALQRSIVCDDVVIGVTVIPKESLSYGPYVVNGGTKMGYHDSETWEWTLVDVTDCKVLVIKNKVVGAWKTHNARIAKKNYR